MRTPLSLALLILAGFLIWHGINTDKDPAAPYSNASIEARRLTLEEQVNKVTPAATGKDEVKKLASELTDRTKNGISKDPPYVQPDVAALIGVAGLLLALILPRTRFRGLAFLGLVLGALATLAGMLPVPNQVDLVQRFSPVKYVIPYFPRVAQACVALAAITLGIRVRAAPPPPAR